MPSGAAAQIEGGVLAEALGAAACAGGVAGWRGGTEARRRDTAEGRACPDARRLEEGLALRSEDGRRRPGQGFQGQRPSCAGVVAGSERF